jgi:hypothetical protein
LSAFALAFACLNSRLVIVIRKRIPHPIAMRPRKDGAPGWRLGYFASVIVPKRPLA